jgi:hypothetical protein
MPLVLASTKNGPANSAFEAPANSGLKLELAAELTDSLENIRYLFEINAVIMV